MSDFIQTVRQYYPNAMSTADTVHRLLDIIEQRFGLKPDQIMHADSLCCDDVNAIQYPARAYEMLGPFKLGGLDGYPFAGLTGMGAFAHHVPENGAIVIFYAPHIGISKNGQIGEINRYGQKLNSACCGAAQAALTKLKNGTIQANQITDLDYQMNTLEQILLKNKERVLSADNPLFEVTEVIYEAIDQQIDLLISQTNYPCEHLFQIGGIFINGDKDIGSFCAYKRFDYINLHTQERQNLMV
jgi:Leucine-rich repeat (LRR) protein